ncbi:hypothetical protein OIU77_004322 [Salix suchowensis]|uniref:Uncharacterized protein n=1 Tax=Salix suchowensis TaxID=1278906 RepID=A0ABQ9AWQ7_9ROSI|nr:hypothetical protein OIU77_004322 [Salix suchowensis]
MDFVFFFHAIGISFFFFCIFYNLFYLSLQPLFCFVKCLQSFYFIFNFVVSQEHRLR